MRYLIDEDTTPQVAVIARNLGLDAVSVHEIGRREYSDSQQFEFAIGEGRIVVTRNRDDFIALLIAAFEAGVTSPGVLIIPRSLPNDRPAAIAHALKRWNDEQQSLGGAEPGVIDFLS